MKQVANHGRWQLIFGGVAALLWVGCAGSADAPVRVPSDENCASRGDEDGNGLADCADPACSAAIACAVVCGNAKVDPGEACDDGNAINGDGCDDDCTLTDSGPAPGSACGDGNVDPGEACDDGNAINGDGCDDNCTATGCGNGVVTAGEVCDDGNAINDDRCDASCVRSNMSYLKASDTLAGRFFGDAMAMSSDGSTLAVGTQSDTAYLFVRDGASWRQDARLQAPHGGAFGRALSLSANGSILAVGAAADGSDAPGHDGAGSGVVYVYTRIGTEWEQQAILKSSGPSTSIQFGYAVSLSRDGATLAAGTLCDNIGAGDCVGRVDIFTYRDGAWSRQASLAPGRRDPQALFGASVSLSGDGALLAIGAIGDSTATTGINNDGVVGAAPDSGAVYVFGRTESEWHEEAYIKASDTHPHDQFGWTTTVSTDGQTLAVNAYTFASEAAGASYIFHRSAGVWQQQAELMVPHRRGDPIAFGFSMQLTDDGSMLAAGAFGDPSGATGLGGDPFDRSKYRSGAVYMYQRYDTIWYQTAYLKAPHPDPEDTFGSHVAISGDGSMLAVAARGEQSAATGIDGDDLDNSAVSAGAVFVYGGSIGRSW